MVKNKNLYGVILAGGAGTRLWPLSRESYPKQLLKLFGNKTLIQQAFSRLKKIIPAERIYVTTSKVLKDDIYLQLKGGGFLKENILIEPALKNTAPAIGFAAQIIFNKNKFADILVCPSDHTISPDNKFIDVVYKGLKPVQDGFLVTLGIVPTHPSPEYGYIKPAADIRHRDKNSGGWPVAHFFEKPAPESAAVFIDNGYLWNSGMFIFKAEVMLADIKKYLPGLSGALKIGIKNCFGDKFLEQYSALKPISIDYGIMEKTKKAWVIPASFNWCDVGSWKSLHDILPKDKESNVVGEKVFYSECSNSLLYGSPKRLMAAIGLDNVVVVDTEDAVLVAHKDRLHGIKNIIGQIKDNNLSQYREHPTVYRPWGSYTILEEGPGFKVKKIRVMPGRKLSLQTHKIRSEHWVVLTGRAKVQLNDKIMELKAHESIGIPKEAKHRLENPGKELLDIVEIQNGSYLGEDDIIRFDDKYGRDDNNIKEI